MTQYFKKDPISEMLKYGRNVYCMLIGPHDLTISSAKAEENQERIAIDQEPPSTVLRVFILKLHCGRIWGSQDSTDEG